MPSKRMPSNSNKWYCSFYYTDYQGKRKRKKKEGFETKRQADEWERDFLNNIEFNPEMNFKSLYEMYIKDIGPTLKEYTLRTKKYIIESRVLPYFQDMQLKDIKPLTIKRWQNELIAYKDKNNKGFSPVYLRNINKHLSAIFGYAVKFHDLKDNPCSKVEKMGKAKSGEMKIWAISDFNNFMSFVKDPVLHLGFNLLFWCGLRIGELLALTFGDIDTLNKTLTVNKSYQRIDGKDIITEPKTPKSNRIITISDSICEEIEYYKTLQYNPQNGDRVFNCTRFKFEHAIKNICNRNNIDRIRLHDLRHSHASILIDKGMNIIAISKRLGHENPQTTLNVYAHILQSNESEIEDLLNTLTKKDS